jgi:uncharacterized protein (TIGR02265 family)
MNILSKRVVGNDDVVMMVKGNGVPSKPELLESIKRKFGYDYSKPPLDIPVETYMAMAEYLRQALFPALEDEAAYEALGTGTVEGHFQGIGKVNKIAARMLGPERSIEIWLKARTIAFPFARHEADKMGKGFFVYHTYGLPSIPEYTRGVMLAALRTTGAKNPRVIFSHIGPEENIYEATWE